MLTSSDAKWRCLWYMFVWSVLLTLVSQFLFFRDHVSFYIFAVPSIIVLPALTAVYSNTAGKHGAGILRVGYVICDPVLACLTITPILVVNHLPADLEQRDCFTLHSSHNDTVDCLRNATQLSAYRDDGSLPDANEWRTSFLTIQCFLLLPVLIAMLMWRRTRKMSLSTFLLATAYWSSVAVESADLLQLVVGAAPESRHSVFTVIAMVCIATVVANSYAVVTLCSYVSPITSSLSLVSSPSLDTSSTASSSSTQRSGKRFDVVYTLFVGMLALAFVQVPLISARFQILAQGGGGGGGGGSSSEWRQQNLTGVFYLWLAHDIIQALAIPIFLLSRQCDHRCIRLSSCGPQFDSTDVFFQPEKRDKYIMKRRRSSALNNPSTAARDGASIYSNGVNSVRRNGSSSSAGSGSTANTALLVMCEVTPSSCESSFDVAKLDAGPNDYGVVSPFAIMPPSPAVAARTLPMAAATNGGVRERHSWIQQHQLQQQQQKNDNAANNSSSSTAVSSSALQSQISRSDSVGSDGKRKTVRFITNGYNSVPERRIQEESEDSSDVV